MLISIVERFQEKGEHEEERYGAWTAAIRRLSDQMESEGDVSIEQLPDYLDTVPEVQKASALLDLIAVHLELSWAGGYGRNLDQYCDLLGGSYPALASVETIPADLVEDEFLARSHESGGDTPLLNEYETRFAARPELAKPVRDRHLAGGRYVRLHRIGHGAMGVVWEGYDHESGHRVAIKMPLPGVMRQPGLVERFLAEAKLTSGWDHPGIVGVEKISAPSEEDPPFYVMRLVGPETIWDRVQACHKTHGKERRTQLRKVLLSLIQVSDAIEYAHSQGVAHGDLTPGNVACDDEGNIAVLDWGMAREISPTVPASSADETPGMVGTPEYMAPEQLDGIIDVRTDVFGLGAILFEILSGRSPYRWEGRGTRPEGWTNEVRQAAFLRPRKIIRRIPRKLESLCLTAMAKEPEDRFQTASGFGEALRKIVDR